MTLKQLLEIIDANMLWDWWGKEYYIVDKKRRLNMAKEILKKFKGKK